MLEIVSLRAPLGILPGIDLLKRRSARQFGSLPITLDQLGAVLYAAQGVRNDDGKRLVPSAGASYPLQIRVAAQNVVGLAPGFYRYLPIEHGLQVVEEIRNPLDLVADAAFDAPWLGQAAAVLLISAEFERTTLPFIEQPPKGRAERYVWLEAGHAAQNIGLAAAALSLATVFVGGFHDTLMGKAFRSGEKEQPCGAMPLGHPREEQQVNRTGFAGGIFV
jgi:SagB-type dehydrogenase family enzyme